MFSKFRRVLVFLLTSSAVFICFICMRDSLWYRPRRRTIYYLANDSVSSSAAGRNVYSLEEESGEDINDIPSVAYNNKDAFEPVKDPDWFINSDTHSSSYIKYEAGSSQQHLAKRFADSRQLFAEKLAVRTAPDFTKLETLLLFIGYPRSGSTLFGSLLDAHPNIIIANEYNLLGKWKNMTKKERTKEFVYMELWKNSVAEALSKQRAADSKFFFSYFVPGMWQGKYRDFVKIIGDKKCTSTTRRLSYNSMRFSDLFTKLELPIKFIHIIRNPFDNIATMTLRSGALRVKAERKGLRINAPTILQRQTQIYFNLLDMNTKLRKKYGSRVLDVDYSSFIRQPRHWWKRICVFLGITCSNSYLNAVEKIVFKNETYTRRNILWPLHIKQKIMAKIDSRLAEIGINRESTEANICKTYADFHNMKGPIISSQLTPHNFFNVVNLFFCSIISFLFLVNRK